MVRVLLAAVLLVLGAPALAQARERAPGAPGGKATWAPADKQGFGTSRTSASRVWFTLRKAELSELYYPDLSHPSARSLDFMVDGKRVSTGSVAQDTLTYTQTSSTSKWRLTRTYASDPERSVGLGKVRCEALDGENHDDEGEYDPQLYNDGSDDVGWTRGHALLSHASRIASARGAR